MVMPALGGFVVGKYDAIATWLAGVKEAQVELSFEEVERITGLLLPPSAAKHAAFWSQDMIVGPLFAVGWKAQPQLRKGRVRFTRQSPPSQVEHRLSPAGAARVPDAPRPDLVLVGCVKSKRPGRHPAKDLFNSALFYGRRARAEAAGAPWYVLSAKNGLVHPNTTIEDYDIYLPETPIQYRQAWARRVLEALASVVGDLRGKVVEIHAGEQYRAGILDELRRRGAIVNIPLQGLTRGEQLAWYASRGWQSNPTTPPRSQSAVPVSKPIEPKATVTPTPTSDGLVRKLTTEFLAGGFNLSGRPKAPAASGWEAMPEAIVARVMKDEGAADTQIRLFMTLVSAMDRAREAVRLWYKALDLFKTQPRFFDPSLVVPMNASELRDGLASAGVSQRHSIDIAAWRRICEALLSDYSPPAVKRAVFDGFGDAAELLAATRARDAAGQPWFPLLGGPKVSAMWVRMLVAPGGAHLTNIEAVPVAVDVQVRKVTEYLGVTDTGASGLEAVRGEIQAAWASRAGEVLGPPGLVGTTAFLDPILWFFGKWGCTHCERVGTRRPISTVCAACRFPERGGTSVKPRQADHPSAAEGGALPAPTDLMNLAFIGIGAMGRHMATNLARAGFSVAAFDARAEALAAVADVRGVRVADDLRVAVEGVDAVCLSLPGPKEVEAIVAGPGGLGELLPVGALVIDLSTNAPSVVRRLAAGLAMKGIGFLDAPVSGGDDGAAAGTLAVMVGGPAEQFERARPVLDAIGKNIFHCGDVGSGSVTKLCNNLAGAVNGLAAAEVLTLGVKAGVDLGTLAEVIGASTGASWKMSRRFPLRLFKGQFEPGFSVQLSAKDTALALELADELGVPIEAGRLAQAALVEAIDRGWAGLDVDAVARLQEERAGVQLRLPEE